MAQLTLIVPDAAIPNILKGFLYDPVEHGSSPAEKAAFVKSRLIDYLKVAYRRGDLQEHLETHVPDPDPDVT